MKRCLEKDLFGVCFVCAGGGEGMIKESEGGYEGVVYGCRLYTLLHIPTPGNPEGQLWKLEI